MRFSQLTEWLTWFETLSVQRTPDQTLLEVATVANRLQLMPTNEKIITVTGTNGKGSCAALLASIYHEADYQTGTFTSPHLIHFHERIHINKQCVSDESIMEAFDLIDQTRQSITLSYFHFAFLAALYLFKKARLDLLILEVGIGGLYDVVNLIDADLAIISSIDLDHCKMLGNTRSAIATQKAGIMRPHKPAICGDFNPPITLFQAAKNIDATLYCQNTDFHYHVESDHHWSWHLNPYRRHLDDLPIPRIYLPNAATVLMGIECLHDTLPLSHQSIVGGLRNCTLPARCQQILFKGKHLLIDVAHNPASIKHLHQHIQHLNTVNTYDKIYAVFGMLADKDIKISLQNFRQNDIDEWFFATLDCSRGTESTHLASCAKQFGIERFSCHNTVMNAFEACLQKATERDLVVIFGSFRVAAQIMENIEVLDDDIT